MRIPKVILESQECNRYGMWCFLVLCPEVRQPWLLSRIFISVSLGVLPGPSPCLATYVALM